MRTTFLYHCLPAPVITDEFESRAMYDKDLGKRSRGYRNPNTGLHYDPVERRGDAAWRKYNPPTAETVADDSFGQIFGDFITGIGTLGRLGFGGGKNLLQSIVELMESKVKQVITPSSPPPATDSHLD